MPPHVSSRSPRAARRAGVRAVLVLVAAGLLAACDALTATKPAPTPADFPGIALELVRAGIAVERVVSGEAGCDDIDTARTAIRFQASGLDQAEPATIYVYIFRNRDAYERLRATVDACAQEWVSDPHTFESIDASPYVMAGQGPWAPEFGAKLREALRAAAGDGG